MSQTMPLVFAPQIVPKMWGNHRWRYSYQYSAMIGEVILLDDHSKVDRSPWEWRLLEKSFADVWQAHRRALVGYDYVPKHGDRFPLRVKHLGIGKGGLSIQLHPALARPDGVVRGKEEYWYILKADADSKLYVGTKPGTQPRDFLKYGDSMAVCDLLNEFVPRVGQLYSIPAGTVHGAVGDIELLEIQTPYSEIHRLYDWGRTDRSRPVHPADVCESIITSPRPPLAQQLSVVATKPSGESRMQRFRDTGDFVIENLQLADNGNYRLNEFNGKMIFCYGLSGQALLLSDSRYMTITAGSHVLIPADADLRGWYGAIDDFSVLMVTLAG